MTTPNISHAIAEMIRKMPDDQIVGLVKGQLDRETVPAPEPRRKRRKMRKAAPTKGTKKGPAKFKKGPDGKPVLTANEKKAIKAVSNARSPLTVKEASKKIGLTISATLSLMGRLADKGLIVKRGEGGGKKRPNRWVYEAK